MPAPVDSDLQRALAICLPDQRVNVLIQPTTGTSLEDLVTVLMAQDIPVRHILPLSRIAVCCTAGTIQKLYNMPQIQRIEEDRLVHAQR